MESKSGGFSLIQPFMLSKVVNALREIAGLHGLPVDIDVHGFGCNRAAVAKHKITLDEIEYAPKSQIGNCGTR